MQTPADLTLIAWRLSLSESSTFAETATAHEAAEEAHRAASEDRSLDQEARDAHYSAARTHRIEAQMLRKQMTAGR